ncbi:helix-turn-helix domain-containing protein [Gemmata sp. G18]|uniref:Helix-turn-helix domain-containing protein n=1 Tax=Gemmata palustris TaxID=2822762 RepID=A0ABS5BXI8_9BACT|nr:helix-turn-helix domain-containing protein [Gemmata palustris]MBP3958414.1 helix-turn-helix domain-containing protein [Gemmata palustris]
MLTVKQAAERAAVSESLIYAWIADGTLPHVRLGRKGKRGTIRVSVEDLDGALATFKVGKSEPGPAKAPARKKAVTLKHLQMPS